MNDLPSIVGKTSIIFLTSKNHGHILLVDAKGMMRKVLYLCVLPDKKGTLGKKVSSHNLTKAIYIYLKLTSSISKMLNEISKIKNI